MDIIDTINGLLGTAIEYIQDYWQVFLILVILCVLYAGYKMIGRIF